MRPKLKTTKPKDSKVKVFRMPGATKKRLAAKY